MRAVNLLPAQHRRRVPTGGRSGSAYVVLGLLGLVLAATVVYVVTANLVTAREDEAARVAQEADAAEAEAASLAPFGAFEALKTSRLATVSAIAQGRLDWERMMRELALVIPRDAWLAEVEAAVAPEEGTEEGATAPTDTDAPPSPAATLTGCAKSQPTVARMMVRLRRLNGATDVSLEESARTPPESTSGSTGAAASAPSSAPSSSASSTEDCGKYYAFTATVTLAPPSVTPPVGLEGEKVPVSLGGGP
jgi:Tfp pilus assembly protein PilN